MTPRTAGARIWCALLFLAATTPALAQPPPPRETVVMPFGNPQTEARLYWLGEGSAVLLADYLDRFGATTIPRDARTSAFERLQLPPAAALSHATVIKVAQFVGATDVVVGSYELAGEHLTVHARLIRLDAGRLLPEIVERGPLTDLFAIYERIARRLLDATSPSPRIPAGTVLASRQALEIYVKGLVAETALTQRSFFEQALKLAPHDDRVRLALWQVHTDLGDHLMALDGASAVPATSRFSRSARYVAALSQIDLKRYDQAFDALKALASETRSAEALNALGVVQLLRGSTPQSGKPAYYFNQAAQTDPSDPDYYFNLGYAYWLDRDPPAAVYWLREAVRRDPADGDAHYVLGAALQQTNALAEAARERDLARQLSSSYAEWDKRASGSEAVPRGLERRKERLDGGERRAESRIASADQRDATDLAAFYLAAGHRAFEREADRDAEYELRRAIFVSPYLADAHLLLGRIYLRGGRTAEAVQAFKIALWSQETVAAHIALAEAYLQLKDLVAARAAVDRALVLEPASDDARALRDRIARAKM
jgi:tetratricopeptide (TPR) repeat protein